MGAASFIGRVGGLAVAIGVGTAVLIGHGVASAETDSAGSSSTTSESASTSSSTAADSTPGISSAAGVHDRPKIDANPSERDRPPSPTGLAGLDRRVPNGRTAPDAPAPANSARSAEPDQLDTTASAPSGSATVTTRATARNDTRPSRSAGGRNTSSPGVSPAPADDLPAAPEAPAPPPTDRVSATAASPANSALSARDTNTPAAPVDSPVEWLLGAVARRELIFDNPIAVNPTVEFDDGVIEGDLNASGTQNPLVYTVIGDPSAGGKVNVDDDGSFTFLPYGTVVDSRGIESFTVLVSEKTPLVVFLEGIPLVGLMVEPIVVQLHQVPILGDILQPIIGYAVTVPVNVDINAVVPPGTPVAFTVKVISFDGTPISTNFFPAPAATLLPDGTAPTLLYGPGLAMPGETDPEGLEPFRSDGYNMVTWDPRGEFDSGGLLNLDSPFFEARDVSAIIDWLAERPDVQKDENDPRLGMVGGSYGGGIQFVAAATDHRIDAIVPMIAWHSLNSSLYKNNAVKTGWGAFLLFGLVGTGARINPQIYEAMATGLFFGTLTTSQQAMLASSGPTVLVNNITAPTLLIQGTVDTLFTLQEAVDNAAILDANGVPTKMIWFCGGHGDCLSTPANQSELIGIRTLAWLQTYVKKDPVNTGPTFEYVDQNGLFHSSDLLPSDPDFYGTPIVTRGTGGFLPIIPIAGGSGPQWGVLFPLSLFTAAPASNALNLTTTATAATQIVGAPELTFTYSGIGNRGHVYAQLVDNKTGLVLGNIVTPIEVILDGQTHTVTVSMEQVAQSMEAGDSITLQIVGSSTLYENFAEVGIVQVFDIELRLPTPKGGVIAL